MNINLNNYEAYAVDYIDGTLSSSEKAAFEAFLVKHPKVGEELEMISDMTLSPELITHPDKRLLHRKEKKIIPLYWSLNTATIGIAASILLATLAFGWMYQRNSSENDQIAITMENIDVNKASETKEDLSDEKILAQQVPAEDISQSIIESHENPRGTAVQRSTEGLGGMHKSAPKESGTHAARTESYVELLPLKTPGSFGEGIMRTSLNIVSIAGLTDREIFKIDTPDSVLIEFDETALATVDPVNLKDEGEKSFGLLSIKFRRKHQVDFNGTPRSYGDVDKKTLKEALLPGTWKDL